MAPARCTWPFVRTLTTIPAQEAACHLFTSAHSLPPLPFPALPALPALFAVGLDTMLSILEGWKADYPDDPAFVVPDSLRQKVAEGKYGRKNGEGFFKWEGDKLAAQQ